MIQFGPTLNSLVKVPCNWFNCFISTLCLLLNISLAQVDCHFPYRMNMSNTNNTQRDWKPSTPTYGVILWCITYSLTAVGIICANVFAVFVFTMKRLLRKRSNILLLNLAIADLMVGSIAFPMYIYIFYNSHKSFLWRDMITNHVYLGVDVFSGLSSMFILAMIALERAYSVYRPLKHRCVSRRSRLYWLSAACVWVTSGVLTSMKILTSLGVLTFSYDKHVIFIFVSIALMTIIAADRKSVV